MNDKPDYEASKKLLEATLGAVDLSDAEQVHWDKKAPVGPPTPLVRQVPGWFEPVLQHLTSVTSDEGLVLDLCLERAMDIVEFNIKRRMVGIDYFADSENGSGVLNLANLTAISAPLAVELYKQVLANLSGPGKQALETLVKKAIEKRDAKITPA